MRGSPVSKFTGRQFGVPATVILLACSASFSSVATAAGLRLAREREWLVIHGTAIAGNEIRIRYLEAYCRAGSTDADWFGHTVIPHTNEFISLSPDKTVLRLRDTLADGLTVEHTITAKQDEVDFRLVARNPTAHRSEAHWAQPCVRLGAFTGFSSDLKQGDLNDYLPKCFILLDGQLARVPTRDWATSTESNPALALEGGLIFVVKQNPALT